ncbi:MAG: type III pantothenate kinase [Bacteroidota bacterium]
MHNLVIDIGNTNQKLAIFNGRDLVHYQKEEAISAQLLRELIGKYQVVKSVMSSVGEQHDELVGILQKQTQYLPFSTSLNAGVKNNYATPLSLGLDRWAKVLAAKHSFPAENCFIIDSGTCITFDLLNAEAEYYGGSISPGIGMRFEALNHYTKRLPLLKWNLNDLTIPQGIDTNSAIRNGVLQGVLNEIVGNIHIENDKNKQLKVLITGGDATFLLEQLKNSIFAPQIIHDPYLVLKGLNEVIAFEYVQKD